MHRTLLLGSALAVLVFSGIVHGLWTDRWSDQLDLTAAAGRLAQLPDAIGPWHGTDVKLGDDDNLGLAGAVSKRYVHTGTGKTVTLYLACGRSGPVCTHTPDVCYGGSGYIVETPRKFQLTAGSADAPPEFFTARFEKRKQDSVSQLRIFWGWRTSAGWRAAENPRLAFAAEPLLHKMYLIREMAAADEPVDTDPCVAFMGDLLPVLQQTLYTEPQR